MERQDTKCFTGRIYKYCFEVFVVATTAIFSLRMFFPLFDSYTKLESDLSKQYRCEDKLHIEHAKTTSTDGKPFATGGDHYTKQEIQGHPVAMGVLQRDSHIPCPLSTTTRNETTGDVS